MNRIIKKQLIGTLLHLRKKIPVKNYLNIYNCAVQPYQKIIKTNLRNSIYIRFFFNMVCYKDFSNTQNNDYAVYGCFVIVLCLFTPFMY